jgi:hypothetical protein
VGRRDFSQESMGNMNAPQGGGTDSRSCSSIGSHPLNRRGRSVEPQHLEGTDVDLSRPDVHRGYSHIDTVHLHHLTRHIPRHPRNVV